MRQSVMNMMGMSERLLCVFRQNDTLTCLSRKTTASETYDRTALT